MATATIAARKTAAALAAVIPLAALAACSPNLDLPALFRPQPAAPPPSAQAAIDPLATIDPPPPKPTRKPQLPIPAAAPGTLSPPSTQPSYSPPTTAFERIIGVDQPTAIDLLGEPQQRVDAPPATVWRYAGKECELDVYFYLDLQSRVMRVLHYEVRSHDSIERPTQRCYDQLVPERGGQVQPTSGSDRPR